MANRGNFEIFSIERFIEKTSMRLLEQINYNQLTISYYSIHQTELNETYSITEHRFSFFEKTFVMNQVQLQFLYYCEFFNLKLLFV